VADTPHLKNKLTIKLDYHRTGNCQTWDKVAFIGAIYNKGDAALTGRGYKGVISGRIVDHPIFY